MRRETQAGGSGGTAHGGGLERRRGSRVFGPRFLERRLGHDGGPSESGAPAGLVSNRDTARQLT